MTITIQETGVEEAALVFEWVLRLLRELGDEADDLGTLDRARVTQAWRDAGPTAVTLVARTADGEIAGISTVVESFAIYANGTYGVINEMYVAPPYRSKGVGARLIDAVKELAGRRGWARIDVTAPESPAWDRTRRFYESQGFVFTGPKLKFVLDPERTDF
jgi:GNAT superfamily N-acetyltransferase